MSQLGNMQHHVRPLWPSLPLALPVARWVLPTAHRLFMRLAILDDLPAPRGPLCVTVPFETCLLSVFTLRQNSNVASSVPASRSAVATRTHTQAECNGDVHNLLWGDSPKSTFEAFPNYEAQTRAPTALEM